LFAAAIRDQLGSPAVIGVQEAGTVEVLRALGARTGGYEAVLLEGCDFGGIDVGLLYQPARVRVLAARQLQTEAPEFRKPACTLPDGRRFTDPLLDRPSLRVDLELDGVPLTLVVNHWRSQIGGRDDQRLATARFLAAELAGIRNLVLLGDFNDTEDSESILALTLALGLVNLSDAVPPHRRYSLIFEGLSQTLDHILVSATVAARVGATGFAHYNADFPERQRTSDHDNPWASWR